MLVELEATTAYIKAAIAAGPFLTAVVEVAVMKREVVALVEAATA